MKHPHGTRCFPSPIALMGMITLLILALLGCFLFHAAAPADVPVLSASVPVSGPILISQENAAPALFSPLVQPSLSPLSSHSQTVINILLVGQDRQEDEGRTRSDSMILCTFNKDRQELLLTSFLRDLYVTIPGYGGDRMNAAYAYGGMELLDATLKENFGLQVDGMVEVDFSRFAQIIDRLGGVDIELREDEAALIGQETGTRLSQGMQHLNGAQALSFSRIRKLDADGDFSRTSRQRRVMRALLDTYQNASLPTLFQVMTDLLPMLSTNLSSSQILGYAFELFPLLSGGSVREQTVPAAGSYTDQYINGMAVLVPDLQAARESLSGAFAGSQ